VYPSSSTTKQEAGVAPRAKIRQNPPVLTGVPGGEFCPEHGVYQPPCEALESRRQATAAGMAAPRARRLLEHAEQLRRTCPQCRDVIPTMGRWATRIRCAIAEATANDPFAPRCPFCEVLLDSDDPFGDRHRCT
jgi:hypothetical protein